ncbi:hypothetical protein Tco_0993644, partial [Tanacetum coccineum]
LNSRNSFMFTYFAVKALNAVKGRKTYINLRVKICKEDVKSKDFLTTQDTHGPLLDVGRNPLLSLCAGLHRQGVAGDLLKQYEDEFRGETFVVTWNYLRKSINTRLSQSNPVTTRWEEEDQLQDPKFQLDACRIMIQVLEEATSMPASEWLRPCRQPEAVVPISKGNHIKKVSTRNLVKLRSDTDKDYISKLPDEILLKILTIHCLDSGSKTVALLTGLWNKPWIIKHEGTTTNSEFENVIIKFIENFDAKNPLDTPRRLEYHFNEGLILTATIGLENKLHLDFSKGNQVFSEQFVWDIVFNTKGPVKLNNLSIRDCVTLNLVFVEGSVLKSLRCSSGSLGWFRCTKELDLDDVMLDFKLGPRYNGVHERINSKVLKSIQKVKVLTLHAWMCKYIFETWDFKQDFKLSKLEDLWWIDSCMEDDNINLLSCFLKYCHSLKRLFITIDPKNYLMPKPLKMNNQWEEGQLPTLKVVKLKGVDDKGVKLLNKHLIKVFNIEAHVFDVRNGISTCLIRIPKRKSIGKAGRYKLKFCNRFIEETEEDYTGSSCKHPHML